MVAVAEKSPAIREIDINAIGVIDREISQFPKVECPVSGIFTKGLYTRRIFMPAGTRIRSKIHDTEHQYIVSPGVARVSENGAPMIQLVAPYHGITKPGTWRELWILMDCIWTTMHPTDKTTVEEVEAEIIASMEGKS
jgi:hypothetical protein